MIIIRILESGTTELLLSNTVRVPLLEDFSIATVDQIEIDVHHWVPIK